MASKDWYPSFGFSRRSDKAFVNFVTSVGKKVFGLFGMYFYFYGAAVKNTVTALTSASNHIAVDASLGNVFTHTTSENTTLDNPTNLQAGAVYHFKFLQGGAARTLAFGSAYKRAAGAFTITAGATATDTLSFYSDGTNLWEIARAQNQS